MRVLLDTHVFLWAIAGSPSLKAGSRRLIQQATRVYVSAASIWEVAIKSGLGKIDADVGELVEAIGSSGFNELSVTAAHAARVASLPPLHADPFDRLLIAQALVEPLHLLTADATLLAYSDLVTKV